MKKLELVFFPMGFRTCAPEAYICALGYEEPNPRSGHVLLTSEISSEAEFDARADELISQLKALKTAASRKFQEAKSELGKALPAHEHIFSPRWDSGVCS